MDSYRLNAPGLFWFMSALCLMAAAATFPPGFNFGWSVVFGLSLAFLVVLWDAAVTGRVQTDGTVLRYRTLLRRSPFYGRAGDVDLSRLTEVRFSHGSTGARLWLADEDGGRAVLFLIGKLPGKDHWGEEILHWADRRGVDINNEFGSLQSTIRSK